MISVVIACYIVDEEVPELLKRCVASLVGYDELIVYSHKGGFGFAESWNLATRLSKGDFLVFIGCSNVMVAGNLKDLAVADTVTSPLVNGASQEFWGFVFCMPRDLALKFGPYDMDYNEGSHMEDEDLWRRLKKEGVPLKSISSVDFAHNLSGKSIMRTPDVDARMGRNRELFSKKWG